jgi:hypothetical protein
MKLMILKKVLNINNGNKNNRNNNYSNWNNNSNNFNNLKQKIWRNYKMKFINLFKNLHFKNYKTIKMNKI